MIVAPSILSVKEEERNNFLTELENLGIKYLHLDIMDGKFVPNTTEKVELLKKINHFNFIFDTHLMVHDPEEYIEDFIEAGSNLITFHLEVKSDIMACINLIRSAGAKCGISIKPNTAVKEIVPYLPIIDQVLVMSVEPGFGGQKFIPSALDKIKELDQIRKNNPHLKFDIEVDGGIKKEHIKILKEHHVDIIVMGTALTQSDSPKELIDEVHLV